eukprot:gene2099-2238_t
MRHPKSPKQILIVVAHPSEAGYSRQLAQTYAREAQSKGNEVKILDLYHDEMAQEFLNFQHVSELKNNPQGMYFRQLLSWADEYIFSFPIWWYDAPAIFKNFFESSFISGYAYVRKEKFTRGLLNDKKVQIYATADGPSWMYYLRVRPFIDTWKSRLAICGIQKVRFHIVSRNKW